MPEELPNEANPVSITVDSVGSRVSPPIRATSEEKSRDAELEGSQSLPTVSSLRQGRGVHPTWQAFIELCRQIGYGEIERLSIQDGLPVLAETVKRKVRFTR